VREALAGFESLSDGHLLVVDVADDLPPVRGDRRRSTRWWGQLVENAVKYSPDGGRIAVTADSDADSVTVSVCDEGVGLADTDTELIFERFYQVPGRSGTGGLGLGALHRPPARRGAGRHGARLRQTPAAARRSSSPCRARPRAPDRAGRSVEAEPGLHARPQPVVSAPYRTAPPYPASRPRSSPSAQFPPSRPRQPCPCGSGRGTRPATARRAPIA
jgi:hypothetical protein